MMLWLAHNIRAGDMIVVSINNMNSIRTVVSVQRQKDDIIFRVVEDHFGYAFYKNAEIEVITWNSGTKSI